MQPPAGIPGVGRITGIAIDQNNSDHIIVGANTGGVWKTLDGGQNWMPLGDYFSNLRVYSVTIDPTNSDHYFFGSNNGLIYHSLDAGATWNLLSDMGNSIVNKILIHPTRSLNNFCYLSKWWNKEIIRWRVNLDYRRYRQSRL